VREGTACIPLAPISAPDRPVVPVAGVPQNVPVIVPPGHFVKLLGYARVVGKGFVNSVEVAAFPGRQTS
jgi:hypothetical protein